MTTTTNINNLKKDLQKTVKKFRDNLPKTKDFYGEMRTPAHPKAMLTGQQMKKRTATINFGYNCKSKHDNLIDFANSDMFKTFCENYNIKIGGEEINSDNYIQLRLYF